MKKLLIFMAAFAAAGLFGADAAKDVILSQRNDGNTGNIQRNITGTAYGLFSLDSSGHPIALNIGSSMNTWLATPSSANLAAALSDKTGTGLVVFGTSPTFTTSVLTDSTTFAAFNTVATTVNAFGAATTLNFGNSSGTTNILGTVALNPAGTNAGAISFKEGTAPSAAAADNVQIYAPANVTTAYDVILPEASSTGVPLWTNSSNVATMTIVAPGTSGNVLTSNGTTWTSAAAAGGGMMIPMYSTSFNWADGAVYYCGATPTNTTTFTATDVQSTSPITGTVTAFSVNFRYTAGSNESVTVVIRNVTTATNSGSLSISLNSGTQATGVVSGLSLAVTAGDQLVAQVTCPTWATNPTAINTSVFCYIQK